MTHQPAFAFVTLTTKYCEPLHQLLLEHYIEDTDCNIRTQLSRDYVYWYLQRARHVVGLTYKHALIGCIGALVIDSMVNSKQSKVAYLNLWCVQQSLRGNGLGQQLFTELKGRLTADHITQLAYVLPYPRAATPNLILQTYVIPVNYDRLADIGFLPDLPAEDMPSSTGRSSGLGSPPDPDVLQPPSLPDNPLHLATSTDIPQLSTLLDAHYSRSCFRPCWDTNDQASLFLTPHKRITYTFVTRNLQGSVTNCISVFITYGSSTDDDSFADNDWTVCTAHLRIYYCSDMSLTDLVGYLIDKLYSYEVDQLVFSSADANESINITKYALGEQYVYFENMSFSTKEPHAFCLPF